MIEIKTCNGLAETLGVVEISLVSLPPVDAI